MENELQEQLNEKKKELMLYCLKNKIPMFFVTAEETQSGTKYDSAVITPREVNVQLSDDKITKFAMALNKHFILQFKSHTNTESQIDDAIDCFLSDE